jgi:hypothetical protein
MASTVWWQIDGSNSLMWAPGKRFAASAEVTILLMLLKFDPDTTSEHRGHRTANLGCRRRQGTEASV